MEKWKIGVIAALLLGLVGYGMYANNPPSPNPNPGPTPAASPTPSPYLGRTIGKEFKDNGLPNWKSIKTWTNTPKPIAISSLQGKVGLIEVFRIQCSHCQAASPVLQALFQRYKSRGLDMVAIQSPGDLSTDNPETRWSDVQTWIKEHHLTYPIGFDDGSQWFQKTIKGELYPTFLVVDPSGKVVMTFTGNDTIKFINLVATLEKLLPSKGTVTQRAQNLAKWLSGLTTLDGTQSGSDVAINDPALQKILVKELEELLAGKAAFGDPPSAKKAP